MIPRTWPGLVGRIGAAAAILGVLVWWMSPPDSQTDVTPGQVFGVVLIVGGVLAVVVWLMFRDPKVKP